jgi:hypothetical protein
MNRVSNSLVTVTALLSLHAACASGSVSTVDAPSPTIAQARQAYSGSGSSAPVTVSGIVTAVQGPVGDQVIWYIEDPAGGPYSGISVYCDPLAATTCPCMATCTPHISAPALNTLVTMTGTISTYNGQVQIEPTVQTVFEINATPPTTYVASTGDLAEDGTSPYRGVYVKYASAVTVDDLTPPALYDTECAAGSGSGSGSGSGGSAMPLCSGCTPPTYGGFEVSAGSSAFFVEETFFPFVPLENSPECLTQPGAVDVTNGETFPFVAGILDLDPYSGKQALSPVQPSDYGQ